MGVPPSRGREGRPKSDNEVSVDAMARFLVRRFTSIFISIIGATLVIFTLSRLGPDPIDLYLGDTQVEVTEEFLDMVRADLGLDKTLPE